MLYSDKVLNNILFFGIEDKHYKKVADNRIELIGNPVYKSHQWAIGSQFNAYLLPGQADNVWEETINLNENATPEPCLGFAFDPTNVNNEIAALLSMFQTDMAPLGTGLDKDVDGLVKKIDEKRKVAGLQKVMDEMQKQVDKWRKANGK